jgi:hypothetical protein
MLKDGGKVAGGANPKIIGPIRFLAKRDLSGVAAEAELNSENVEVKVVTVADVEAVSLLIRL